MLSLYYRWAMQVLSAFDFMHSRSVYIKFYSTKLVWLQSNYSLAITDFISASAPKIEAEQERDAAQHVQAMRRDMACFLVTTSGVSEEAIGDVVEMSDEPWDEGEWAGDEAIN
jgi:hypothetical protein